MKFINVSKIISANVGGNIPLVSGLVFPRGGGGGGGALPL